jgi:hypothetical protein
VLDCLGGDQICLRLEGVFSFGLEEESGFSQRVDDFVFIHSPVSVSPARRLAARFKLERRRLGSRSFSASVQTNESQSRYISFFAIIGKFDRLI